MSLRIDQLKKITLPLFNSKTSWASVLNNCAAPSVSIIDILDSYIEKYGLSIYTDSTLAGKGTQSSPLKIAQQNAVYGNVLTWDGSTWKPMMPTTAALLTYSAPYFIMNNVQSINVDELISSDTPNLLGVGTDLNLRVQIIKDATLSGSGTSGDPLKIAQQGANNGDVLKWNGSTWYPSSTPVTVALSDLTDVLLTSLSSSQILTYNGSEWVNTNPPPSLPSGSGPGQILYWDGGAWVAATPRKNVQQVNSGNQYNLPETPLSALPIDVYLNGVLKEQSVDYNISGAVITFAFNFITNDKVTTKYFA